MTARRMESATGFANPAETLRAELRETLRDIQESPATPETLATLSANIAECLARDARAQSGAVNRAAYALAHLCAARDILAADDCPRALARVRAAIRSTAGAERNARHCVTLYPAVSGNTGS